MSREKLIHPPTEQGIGKWESASTLRKYLKKRKAKNRSAKQARKRNR